MLVGHTAVALAAKTKAPRASFGLLLAASLGLDLLWPVFLLLGIEHVRIEPGNTAFTQLAFESYPWSHSLTMSLIWGLSLTLLCRRRGFTFRDAAVAGALVPSHWVLDFVTHRPDLPLWPGGSLLLGLGLWNSIPGTIAIEGTLFALALGLYLNSTRALDSIGRWAFVAFVLVQGTMWISSPWMTPPPSPDAVAWATTGLWLVVAWAAWIDAHRRASASSLSQS